jgi:uncharacterized protein (TIGR02246 family)
MFASLALVAAVAQAEPACAELIAAARPTIAHANADWIRALKAGDAAALAADYADGGLFVTPDGAVIRGRAAVQALYASRAAGAARIVGGAITSRGMACGGDGLVYEWGTGALTESGPDGQPVTHSGPYLTVWKHIGDEWKIVRNLTF